jgi:hypothetical protein
MFPWLFSAMCAAIALKLCTWLYIYDLQIKFKDGCYWPIFGRVMPLELSYFKGFYSFPHFYSLCLQIFIWYLVHCFAILSCRSSSEFGFDPLIFHKVMAHRLRKISWIFSFPYFFSLCLQIFIWYLVHCFAILSCRSSSSLVLIHWLITKLWPMDLKRLAPELFSSTVQDAIIYY